MEDDSQVCGSGCLSKSDLVVETLIQEATTSNPTLPIHEAAFVDADLVDRFDVEKDYVIENYGEGNPGWCGLDAVNCGLTAVGLRAMGKEEALTILARIEANIVQLGMNVRDLENLLNARDRSVGIVDVGTGMNWKFKIGRKDFILVAADFGHHFVGITKRQEVQVYE